MQGSRIEETLERAKGDQDAESHIPLEMARIWQQAREDEDVSTKDILQELEDVDSDHPVIDALRGLVLWERERDYHDGANPALEAFGDTVDKAIDDDWYNVALYASIQAGMIASDISDKDAASDWMGQLVDLFTQYSEQLTPNTRGKVLDAFTELSYFAKGETLDELEQLLQSKSESAHDEGNYGVERNLIDKLMVIRQKRDNSTKEAKEAIINSYDAQIEYVSDDDQMERSFLFQRALDHCAEYADEEKLNEWKRELRSANRVAIEKEMVELEHEPSDKDIEEIESFIDNIVENARELRNDDHGIAALIFVLSRPSFLPQLEKLERNSDGFSLMESVSYRHMTGEGDAIPDPDERTRPRQYGIAVQHRDNILISTLYRIFDEGIITESDLYTFFWTVDGPSVHDIAYLTDFIIALFDDRYADALHLGSPRLEGVIASLLQDRGYETASLQEGYTQPKPLSSLINMIENVNRSLAEYLRYRYSDLSGQGIRNQVAHGRADYDLASPRMTMILLYDIFRTIATLDYYLQYR